MISRMDPAYQRWLGEATDDVVTAAGVVVFRGESLPERNTTYGIGEWLAGYLMIGQDGDRGFFLRGDGGGPVFSADLGGVGEDDLEVVAPAFEVWRNSGFARPPDPVPDMPLTADVYIDRIPVDGMALLMRARKLLGADWPVGDLRSMLAEQPFLAARSAHPYKLRRELESVPELRPHLFYSTDAGLKPVRAAGN